MDERNRGTEGERAHDGLGHDAPHGHRGQGSGYQGGSVGRSTGRAGDDLTDDGRAGDRSPRGTDDATRDQQDAGARRGEIIPGKGFDAGAGYGGAGNDSAYSGESSYGGQSGLGGDSMRGAYAGEGYGRQGDDATTGGDASRGSGSPSGADVPRGTDEQGGERGRRDAGNARERDDENVVDLDVQPNAGRRDPTER